MKTRILVAIPVVAFVLLAIFVQNWILVIFAAVLGIFCPYEVMRAFTAGGRPVQKGTIMTFSVLFAVLFAADYFLRIRPGNSAALLSAEIVLLLEMLAAGTAFVCSMFLKSGSFSQLKNTVFVLIYPQLLIACFYLLILRAAGAPGAAQTYVQTMTALLLLFMPPMLSDTFAYFWGRRFGHRKLAPAVSPNKTVEGSIAGLAGGAAGGFIVWLFALTGTSYGITPPGCGLLIVLGVLLALVSQIGDLCASYIKRAVGIKDFGKLLPGHGGVMDRVDSTMFTAPLVLAFLTLL